MYKSTDYDYEQLSFVSFNSSCGMQLDCSNEWIQTAARLPWRAWENLYSGLFPTTTGNVAKPCRMVLGSMIIQTRMGFTDRDLVAQIRQNPYYQYFIGLESFQHATPFDASLLVYWRKRVTIDFVIKANDLLCDSVPHVAYVRSRTKRGTLMATQICDATVAPQYIRFPQDTSLLNEARRKLEVMIDFFCETYRLEKPRTYRKTAQKEYLAFAKSKKPSADKVRDAVRAQLGYVRRDICYIDGFMSEGYAPAPKFVDNIITIHLLYEQQKYMYDNRVHKVENRIVSITQPYVRPIVRGKASRPTEFGAKLHLSIDETGFGRIEYISFDAYNEGPMLIDAMNAYKYRNGCYPERILVDTIQSHVSLTDGFFLNGADIPEHGTGVVDGTDVVHEHVHIGEYVCVDTLEHVVGCFTLCCFHQQGVVDKSLAEGLDFCDRATRGELVNNGKKFFVHNSGPPPRSPLQGESSMHLNGRGFRVIC